MNDWASAAAAFVAEHNRWAGPIIGLLAFIESLALVGMLIPGTAMMITVGGLIGTGSVDPFSVYAFAVAGAVLGDWLSFTIGRRIGPAVYRRWPLNRHRTAVARSRLFFRRFGFAAVFLGRFLGPVRATIPLVAGVMQMGKRQFQAANILSALLWVPVILAPGFLAARNIGSINDVTGLHLVGFGVAIVLLTLVAGALGAWVLGGTPKQRELRRRRSDRRHRS